MKCLKRYMGKYILAFFFNGKLCLGLFNKLKLLL